MSPCVLITRAAAVSRELTTELRRRGYAVCLAPLLEAQLPASTGPLRELLRTAQGPAVPTWLAVTSATTVAALAAVAPDPGWAAELEAARRATPPLRVAAVGEATAAALEGAGVGVDLVPAGESSAAGMLVGWPRAGAGELALLPASALASATLADGLTARGYRVQRITAYDMVPVPAARPLDTRPPRADDPPTLTASQAGAACAGGSVHAVVATAPSRVAALWDALPAAVATAWVAIGRPTAAALRTRGVVPTVAENPSARALADAVTAAVTGSAAPNDPVQEKTS